MAWRRPGDKFRSIRRSIPHIKAVPTMYNTSSPTAQMYLPLRCLSMATRYDLGGCVVTTIPWMLWSIKQYYYIYKFFLYGISERRYSQRKSHCGFVVQSVHRVDPVSFVWRIKVPFISENRKVRPCDTLFSISLTQTDYFRKWYANR